MQRRAKALQRHPSRRWAPDFAPRLSHSQSTDPSKGKFVAVESASSVTVTSPIHGLPDTTIPNIRNPGPRTEIGIEVLTTN